jgi:hypothetical protein
MTGNYYPTHIIPTGACGVEESHPPLNRHSDRSLRSGGISAATEPSFRPEPAEWRNRTRRYNNGRFLHYTHSADAPCVPVEMTDWSCHCTYITT